MRRTVSKTARAGAFAALVTCAALSLSAAGSTARTPYLERHRDDAVAWRAWGDAAFAEAERTGRLLFVSVGFFACNGCHVMQAESFADPVTAARLNARTIPVLVDRDDRPDVDARLGAALEALGVEPGWPMNVWLLPDGRAIAAATYLPPAELVERTERLAGVWSQAPQRLRAVADAVAAGRDGGESAHVSLKPPPGPELLDEVGGVGAAGKTSPSDTADTELRRLAQAALASADREYGGFTGSPKFPRDVPYTALFEAQRLGVAGASELATRTLDAVLASRLHDPADGGFHRYAVDAAWREPHWEKTLDDNALLALDLLEAWRSTRRPTYREAALSTLTFLERRLRRDDGCFAQALDSDAGYYARTPRANQRPPARDESAIVAANAHAARAFARAGSALGDERRLAVARQVVDRLLAARAEGNVPHALRPGSESGSLADHAALGLAALELFVATNDGRDLAAAREIDRRIGVRFTAAGGSSAPREFVDLPPIALRDRPIPSGASLALELAARLNAWDDPTSRETTAAERARRLDAGRAERRAAFGEDVLSNADGLAAARLADVRIEIVVIGRDAASLAPWREALWHEAPVTAVSLVLTEDRRRRLAESLPLLVGKTAAEDAVRGYVCRRWVCARPATNIEMFVAQLRALRL